MAKINRAPKLIFKENLIGGVDIYLKNKLIGMIYSTTETGWCYDIKLDEFDGNYQGHSNDSIDETKRVVKAIYETYVATNGFKTINF